MLLALPPWDAQGGNWQSAAVWSAALIVVEESEGSSAELDTGVAAPTPLTFETSTAQELVPKLNCATEGPVHSLSDVAAQAASS